MSSYDMISKAGCLNLRKEKKRAEEFSRSVNVKTPSISQLVGNLSGGNQQRSLSPSCFAAIPKS